MSEPRTHYQLSFTGKQAMAFFVVCLLALGLSFFLGLMTGLSGRPEDAGSASEPAAESPPPASPAAESAAAADATEMIPSPALGVPAADESGPAATPPATLQAFEDRIREDPTPAPPTPVRPPAEGVFIQVASLTSRPEADALASRLTRKGFHAQVVAASGPRGRVFRVRVGPFRSEEEAGRTAERLRRQEQITQTWIVREGT